MGRPKSMMSVNVFIATAAVSNKERLRQVPCTSERHALDTGEQANIIQHSMTSEYTTMMFMIAYTDLRYHVDGERRR